MVGDIDCPFSYPSGRSFQYRSNLNLYRGRQFWSPASLGLEQEHPHDRERETCHEDSLTVWIRYHRTGTDTDYHSCRDALIVSTILSERGGEPSALHCGIFIIAARYAEGVRGLVGPNAGVGLLHQELNDERGIRSAVIQCRLCPFGLSFSWPGGVLGRSDGRGRGQQTLLNFPPAIPKLKLLLQPREHRRLPYIIRTRFPLRVFRLLCSTFLNWGN